MLCTRVVGLLALLSIAICAGQAAAQPVKIYILAGQSNMEENKRAEWLQQNHPELAVGFANVWGMGEGEIPFRRDDRWGVETPFVANLVKEVKEPIFIFKSAKGGTTLFKDWRPPSTVKRDGGQVGYLYNRLIRRFHNMIEHIEEICPPAKKHGYEIAAFVWFQGENDTCLEGPEPWDAYEQDLRDLIADVRRDTGVPDLPVLINQINDCTVWDGTASPHHKDYKEGELGEQPKGGPTIRAAQQKVAESDPHGTWISTRDLNPGYHYDEVSYLTIGQRMAEALIPFAKKVVPIDPAKIAAAGKAFREREYPDANPDTSSLQKGLIFYLPFDTSGQPDLVDRISGEKGVAIGEVVHCKGLFGGGIHIGRTLPVHNPDRIEFSEFKEPLTNGRIDSLSVSFWVQAPSGHVPPPISKYASGEGHMSMKDGWRMMISAYESTGMNAMIDGVTEWKPNPKSERGTPYVSARKAGRATAPGDGFEWHHVVAVYDGAAGTMRAYVDADFGEANNPKSWAENIPGRGIKPSADPLTILSASRSQGQRSGLDEFAIWDRPLTEAEIKALYNNGNGVQLK